MPSRLYKILQYLLYLLRLSRFHLLRLLHRIAHSIRQYRPKNPQRPNSLPKTKPTPLPNPRPRALTAASNPRTTPPIPTLPPPPSPQPQSPLFHLPLETRLLIYRHTLVSPLTHIIRLGPRLSHVRCREPYHARPWSHRCWGITVAGSDLYHGPHSDFLLADGKGVCLEEEEEEEDDEDKKKKKRRGLLPLLMTCRRIYTEAMPVLYGENTFSMLHLYSVTSLAETVLPQRLHTIRKVELGWYFYVPYPLYRRRGKSVIGQPTTMDECPPYDIATWERVWDILAGMEGLRELRVDLVGRWSETLTKDEEGMLLGPALKVERPRVWEMRVEWDGGGVDWEGDGAPFRVVRGGGVGEGAEVE